MVYLMCKIFWTLVFCSFSVLFLRAQEAPEKKQVSKKQEYEFIGQIIQRSKLTAVLLAKKKENIGEGDGIVLRDVEFYFPNPEKEEEMGKQQLQDLKAYAKENSAGVRVWRGEQIELNIDKSKMVNRKLSPEDLSSFKWKGPAHLEFGYGLERKVLMGSDISYQDNLLLLPKNFIWQSHSHVIEGAKAKMKMKAGKKDFKKKKGVTTKETQQQILQNFEAIEVSPPIKVTAFVTKKEKKKSTDGTEKKQDGSKSEERRPFVMEMEEKLTGRMSLGTELTFSSKGKTRGYFDDEKMTLHVTGDSVQGSLVTGEKMGIQYLELEEPWCLIQQFSDVEKKKLSTDLNMTGRFFRMFPDSLEVTGQPASIWNKQIVGTVSRIYYNKDSGVLKFKNPDIEIDKDGWKKYQDIKKERKKQKAAEKAVTNKKISGEKK